MFHKLIKIIIIIGLVLGVVAFILHMINKKSSHETYPSKKLFNIDLHISVIEDIKYNLNGKLLVEDWSISDRAYVMGKKEKIVKFFENREWRNFDKAKIKKFVNYYANFLNQFDGFIVTHTPVFALLYMKFNKPIYIINSCRFTQPFCWNNNSQMNDYMIESFRKHHEKGLLHIISNNLGDKQYLEVMTGISSPHIPSLCLYTKAKYQWKPNTFYSHKPHDIVAKMKHVYDPSKKLGNNFAWKDYYNCTAIIHIPYELSTMSIFEQYSANVPLIFPSKQFLKELVNSGKHSMNSISTYGNITFDKPNTSQFTDINFWIDRADYYDAENMKYIVYFDSWEDLRAKLDTTDFKQVSRNMDEWNTTRQATVKTQLNNIFLSPKIISFSLWGSGPCYNWGALENALAAQELFPGWTCRYYIGKDVDEKMLRKLKTLPNVEIIKMKKDKGNKMMWRFAPCFETDDIVIVRDCDSVLNPRDKAVVDAWLASDKDFHIIRDHDLGHGSYIQGGMFGVRNGILREIGNKFAVDVDTQSSERGKDQEWLNKTIYPLIRNNCIVHDSKPWYEDEKDIRAPFPEVDYDGHIGEILCEKYPRIEQKFNIVLKNLLRQ